MRDGRIKWQVCFNGAVAIAEPNFMVANQFAKQPVIEATPRGTHVLRGIRIFKSGTFKDSLGIERTWTDDHLNKMVVNFNTLRRLGAFVDVPVRANHTGDVRDVVGYFSGMYIDPEDHQFLAADIEFTEPDAISKWNRGTFRSRSSEIGMYETNDGTTYFPTVVGLAFVDIGAVEGLHNKAPNTQFTYEHNIVDKESTDMNLEQWLAAGHKAEDWVSAVQYAAWVQAVNYAQALQEHFNQAEQLGVQPGTAPVVTPEPIVTPPANNPLDALQHRQQQTQPPAPVVTPAPVITFSLNGAQVQNYTQVQAHIHALEQFREETVKGGRIEFVNNLVTANKLPSTQLPAELAFVETLSDNQWASYRARWDAAPVHSLFGNYGQQNGAPLDPSAGQLGFGQSDPNAPLDELATAQEIVAQHGRAGKSEDFIKNTKSYAMLAKNNKAPF